MSGLAAALSMLDAREERGLDLEVSLFEQESRLGGCIRTVRERGYTMELGPDSLLLDTSGTLDFLHRLNVADRIVDVRAEFRGSCVVHRGRLHAIPSAFRLFTPTSLSALLKSRIFSARGITRAAMEPFIPARHATEDESLAAFVTRRFGAEVLDRLAQPIVGGIHSGDPRRLSMQATLPQLVQMEREHGSVARAMTAANTHQNDAAVRLVSLRDGLQTIVDAAARRLGSVAQMSREIRALSRSQDGWWIDFADGSCAQADAVVCTLPAPAAARIIRPVDEYLAALLRSVRYNSIATVNLGYDRSAMPSLPKKTGFVVPAIEHRGIAAVTISTQKYPARSPAQGVLLRAFIGGAMNPELAESSDAALVALARRELKEFLAIAAAPQLTKAHRWRQVIPEYCVGHLGLVESIEARARAIGGLVFAGAAYHGAGIPSCIAGGHAAAAQILSDTAPVVHERCV